MTVNYYYHHCNQFKNDSNSNYGCHIGSVICKKKYSARIQSLDNPSSLQPSSSSCWCSSSRRSLLSSKQKSDSYPSQQDGRKNHKENQKSITKMHSGILIVALLTLLCCIAWYLLDSELLLLSRMNLITTTAKSITKHAKNTSNGLASNQSSTSLMRTPVKQKWSNIYNSITSNFSVSPNSSISHDGKSTKQQYNSHVEEKYYTYSQCPFTLSKFSLYQLSHQEQYDHDHDYSITANISTSSKDQKNTTGRRSGLNIMKRAREALDFSMHHNSYHRVQQALEQQAFDNRTIYLEGDSLTRQLFISLGCLAWQAGYVKYYYLGKVHVITKKKNEILANANFDGVDKFFYSASIGLRGGGKIYYHPKLGSREKLMSEAKLLVDQACDRTLNMSPKLEVPFQGVAGNNKDTNKTMIQLGPNDVYLISGGHHMDTRDIMLESYQKALDCFLFGGGAQKEQGKKKTGEEEAYTNTSITITTSDSTNGTIQHGTSFEKWPQPWIYQTSSVPMFWSKSNFREDNNKQHQDEHNNATMLVLDKNHYNGKNPLTCRPSVHKQSWRNEDKKLFHNVTWLLGIDIPLRKLGRLHVGLGDCLHWIQPGVPDVYAAELADYILATSDNQVLLI